MSTSTDDVRSLIHNLDRRTDETVREFQKIMEELDANDFHDATVEHRAGNPRLADMIMKRRSLRHNFARRIVDDLYRASHAMIDIVPVDQL